MKGLYVGFKSNLEGLSIHSNSKIDRLNIIQTDGSDFEIEQSIVHHVTLNSTKIRSFDFTKKSNCANWKIINGNIVDIDMIESKVDTIIISHRSSFKTFGISNCKNKELKCENSKIEYIEIEKKSILLKVDIIENSEVDLFNINNSELGYLNILQGFVNSLNIEAQSKIFTAIISFMQKANGVFSVQNSFIQYFEATLDKAYYIFAKSNQIINIDLQNSFFAKDSYINFSDNKINTINIESFLNLGHIVFTNITSISEFESYKSTANDEVIFKETYEFEYFLAKKPSKFSLANSDVGNTQFIGCNIAAFERFEFLNSKMANVFLADTKLPHRNKIYTGENADLNEQRRLALGQIKKIYDSQGDVVKSIEFRAYEMEVYREQLQAESHKLFSKKWINNLAERFNLWLNKNSSYYGSNWLRAACMTLIVTWVFFTMYCFALGSSVGTNLEEFGRLFSYSFEFLNPIRKNSTLVDEKDVTSLARIVDYVGRVFIAYFVYQTIQAFRKFGKSSS